MSQVLDLLVAIERMLQTDMPPVRRAELENLYRIWRKKLQK